jgi:hypothetical protein
MLKDIFIFAMAPIRLKSRFYDFETCETNTSQQSRNSTKPLGR